MVQCGNITRSVNLRKSNTNLTPASFVVLFKCPQTSQCYPFMILYIALSFAELLYNKQKMWQWQKRKQETTRKGLTSYRRWSLLWGRLASKSSSLHRIPQIMSVIINSSTLLFLTLAESQHWQPGSHSTPRSFFSPTRRKQWLSPF